MANKSSFRNSAFYTVLSLTLICLIVTGAVAAVNTITYERIYTLDQARAAEAMRTVMPDASLYSGVEILESYQFDESVTGFYEASDADGNLIGYCVEATPNGFSDKLGLICGISLDGIVQGVSIVDASKETPGVGSRVTEESFYSQFVGKNAALKLVRGTASAANEVSAVSGATYSSRGVYEGVQSCIRAAATYTEVNGNE